MNTQNSLLYFYGFSLRRSDRITSLLKILKEQIKLNLEINIVLIHDGVIGTTIKEKTPELLMELLNLPIQVYAVIQDIRARGMDPNNLVDNINRIDYNNLVDLLVDMGKIVSWM
ncbi:MAG: sulfurtransferase complex subunit TusB [Candidatus Hodarchaeota archaeon]